VPPRDDQRREPGLPAPRDGIAARSRRRSVGAAIALLALAAAGLLILIRWYGAPHALANSRLAAPLIRILNGVRERAYFQRDDDCVHELEEAGVHFSFVAEPPRRDACPLRNVVRVEPPGLLQRPLYMTCRLARALHRFETLVLQPAAARHFGQPVAHLLENGVRNCRTVAGYQTLLSEHAFANAIDVSGFVLRDGTEIHVAADPAADATHVAFVHEVTARACDVFRTVLGSGFDERHGDHVHFDMGMLGGCRP
jgi:hypothetical protein